MSELVELLERFRRGPELLAQSLTGAAGTEVDFHEPGKWSVRQIIAHLADCEIVLSFRVRSILAEENPTLQAFDQDLWATKLDYAKRKPSHSLESFRRTRSENYELLKDLPPEAFQRSGTHTERGTITVLGFIEYYVAHEERHAAQIRRTRESFKAAKAAGVS
ncbi:MAG TPA: DinB family protein [Bryobacteraceae bacterium]|nr:DinB family protein [Bryobacteraceae bacterium]